MSSKNENAKSETSRLRSLRSATNLQNYDGSQQLNPDKVNQFLQGLLGKGLKHKTDGTLEAEPTDQYQLLVAVEAGDQEALSQIQLGGERKLVSSQTAFCRELVGGVPFGFTLPAPPSVSSRHAAAEMTECYESSMLWDVPFTTINDTAPNAAADRLVTALNAYGNDYKGPKDNGSVNRKLLFRGTATGCQFGPYLSQFLMHDFDLGNNPIVQKYTFDMGVYGVSEANVLELQKGNKPNTQLKGTTPMRPYTPRGLGSLVHVDFVYQFFYYAAQMILNCGINRHGAYVDIYPDEAFVTNGGVVTVATAVADVCKHAMSGAWAQKWRRHLKLRPEEMAIRVVKQKDGVISNVIHPDFYTISNPTIEAVEAFNAPLSGEAKAWLPLMYAEGCPCHPAYPSGHATVAGACATILKMIFENANWSNMSLYSSVIESADGNNTRQYTGTDTAAMTVHTELNKLAANIAHGRMFGNVHYRADGDYGMLLGEKIAIAYYEDYLHRQIEPWGDITFTKFDGTTHKLVSGGGQTRAVGTPARFENEI